jgi:hypothetical protein
MHGHSQTVKPWLDIAQQLQVHVIFENNAVSFLGLQDVVLLFSICTCTATAKQWNKNEQSL